MLRIVSQAIPADNEHEILSNAQTYQHAIEDARRALRRAVVVRVGSEAAFSECEGALLAAANDVCRLELETTLQATADGQPDRVRIDGAVDERHQDGAVTYHSLCGPLEVRRATYRKAGERNGPTVVPLDLAAGLIGGATPALAYRVALGYAPGAWPPRRGTAARGSPAAALAQHLGTPWQSDRDGGHTGGAADRTRRPRGGAVARRHAGRVGRHRSHDGGRCS